MSEPRDRYSHGYHDSVVNTHATRSIADSAAYLEPFLTAGHDLIDIGCGPGSITEEFATRLAPGRVLGVDVSEEVVLAARARSGETGAEFHVMDSYALDVEDGSFDVAHAHQVLQHVTDPVAILSEMRRVVRPGGIVAVRDADYSGFHWAPESPRIDTWLETYLAVARNNGAEPDAGRHLTRWAAEAGFTDVTATHSTWLYATSERCGWLAETWSRRTVESAMAEQAIEAGLATMETLADLSEGWLEWAQNPHAWFVVPHGELICRV